MSVPKPWTAISVTDEKHEYRVDVRGRTYTFRDSLFPTSVVSLGQELLYEPITLDLRFKGEKKALYCCRHDILSQSDDKVVILGAALAGNIAVNAVVTIEYDGMIDIVTRLIPSGQFDHIDDRGGRNDVTPCLDYAALNVKFRPEAAGLFHFWPNTDSGIRVLDVINSGAFFAGELPFKPCLWVGNEDCGLNLCMESDRYMALSAPEKTITTEICDDYRAVTVHLLDRIPPEWDGKTESWLAPLLPLSYEFIFEATPVKKPLCAVEKEWRAYHTFDCKANMKTLAENGVKWVIFHEPWSLIQNYCRPAEPEAFRRAVEECHKYGMKLMVYFGYEYSSAVPEWEQNRDTYLNRDAEGRFTGGWTRQGTYQKAFIACYAGGYSEEMIGHAVRAMEEYGVDGIYTDGTYVPWECANESHGCGYRDSDGKLRVTYPIKAVRAHVKKLYEEIHRRGGIIDTHQSSCCLMPTLGFCDTYFDGENIQGLFSKNLDKFLNMEAFRCEYMGTNFGIIPNFIAYLRPPEYNIRNVLSISLIHDTMTRPLTEETLDAVSRVWRAYDALGMEDAVPHMYWKGGAAVTSENGHLYISTHEKPDRLLAAVSKFSDGSRTETLTVPARFKTAHEVFDDVTYPIENGTFTCPIDPTKAYLFEIS